MLLNYKRITLIGILFWVIAIPLTQAQNKKIVNPAESFRNFFTNVDQTNEPANLIQLYTQLKKSNSTLPTTAAIAWYLEHHEAYGLNFTTNMLEIGSRHYYAYDTNDRITQQLTQVPDPNNSGSWIHSQLQSTTYDANGNITEVLNQMWNNNTWVNTSRYQHTYMNNLETVELYQTWDTQNGWQDMDQYLYTYDSQNNLTEELDQMRDTVNNIWVNTYRYTYTYTNGNIATEEDEKWVNGQWQKMAFYTANYNMQNHLAEVIEQDYDTLKTKYINAYRDQYMYYQISLKDSAYVSSKWDTTNKVWAEDSQVLRFYDSNGKDTKWLYQDWDTNSKAYVDSGQQLYTYDSNMNLSQSDFQIWNNSSWMTYSQLKYYYTNTRPDQVPLPIDEEITKIPRQIRLNQNYPNPFNPSTQIKYVLNASVNVKLNVYDIIGREVATLVNQKQSSGSYTVTFNATRLSSGIYFYRLVTDKTTITKKMILIK